MTNGRVGLADAIEAFRAELQQAVEVGRNEPLRFKFSPIELTLQVEVTDEGRGKIGRKIIELGRSIEAVHTQILKLTLEPGWLQPNGTYLPATQSTIAAQGDTKSTVGPRPTQ